MTPAARKFALHEIIKLPKSGPLGGVVEVGCFEIVRLMPEDQRGEFHYRLKSASGERVARECEMKAIDAALRQSAEI